MQRPLTMPFSRGPVVVKEVMAVWGRLARAMVYPVIVLALGLLGRME